MAPVALRPAGVWPGDIGRAAFLPRWQALSRLFDIVPASSGRTIFPEGSPMSRSPVTSLWIVAAILLGAAALPSALAEEHPAAPGVQVPPTTRPAAGPSTSSSRVREASGFFTDDDGQTLFTADLMSVPPFDHNGREAVRAYVFTTDGGNTRFVAYLEKYAPQAKQAIEKFRAELLKNPSQPPSAVALEQIGQGTLVKKPGQGNWVSVKDYASFAKVVQIQVPPEASIDNLEPVLP